MNVELDKDYPSLKNAIMMAVIFLVITVFFTLIMIMFTLPLEWAWTLVGFAICVIAMGFSFYYFVYCMWYIFAFIASSKEKMIVYRGENGYVSLKVKGVNYKFTRDQIDFVSAKTLHAPLKGIEPNKVELHIKGDSKVYILRMLERPDSAKGLINDLIKGKITKQI
ncbi:MAG: hypothetical protein ACI311_03065 [Bacilli bacterium]